MELKKLSIVLVVILLLCVILSGCTPVHIAVESGMMGQIDILFYGSSAYCVDYDKSGRALFRKDPREKDSLKGSLFLVFQEYFYTENEYISYLDGNYYFYDYNNGGMESDEFKAFLKENHWEEEKLDVDLLHRVEDYRLWGISNTVKGYKKGEMRPTDLYYLYRSAFTQNGLPNDFAINTNIVDMHGRSVAGALIYSTNNEPPKLYALCFQANNGVDTYNYLADVYFKEIRLDHYAEDLEAFKKANNWNEKLSVEDLNAKDK
ncbi:MAG: hypothetical protein RR458_01170 [Clostridia bacterium]